MIKFKVMKTIITLLSLVMTVGLMAQKPSPSFEKQDDMIMATYYHDNGQIAQTGTFLNGELHGKWTMFDSQGNKVAMGQYENGHKAGKWFFWGQDGLKEVDFTDNAITSVIKWNNSESVVMHK